MWASTRSSSRACLRSAALIRLASDPGELGAAAGHPDETTGELDACRGQRWPDPGCAAAACPPVAATAAAGPWPGPRPRRSARRGCPARPSTGRCRGRGRSAAPGRGRRPRRSPAARPAAARRRSARPTPRRRRPAPRPARPAPARGSRSAVIWWRWPGRSRARAGTCDSPSVPVATTTARQRHEPSSVSTRNPEAVVAATPTTVVCGRTGAPNERA